MAAETDEPVAGTTRRAVATKPEGEGEVSGVGSDITPTPVVAPRDTGAKCASRTAGRNRFVVRLAQPSSQATRVSPDPLGD